MSEQGRADFDAIVALGSNVGDKAGTIAQAIGLLTAAGDIHLVRRSRAYRSAPWGKTDQDWFVNACIAVATNLSPHELLARCQEVERRLGRVRGEKWGPRVIDLDLLVWRDTALDGPGLILPHPYITDRAFVLTPLADIAPDLVIRGEPVRDWLARIDHANVVPLA
jgi:2-amino-4-hydroxy-6-hydroxymethyldihydropteridine diphosphokinase